MKENSINKDQILNKSRKENKDEGMEYAENRGRKLGFAAMFIFYISLITFDFFMGKINYAPLSLYCAYIAAESIPKYLFTRKKTYLVSVIGGFTSAILLFVNYVLEQVRLG